MKNEPIPKTDHTYVTTTDGYEAPNCQKEGNQRYVCSVCGAVKNEPIPKSDHSWSQWAPSTEGKESRTCSVCGATEERDVPVAQPSEPPTP